MDNPFRHSPDRPEEPEHNEQQAQEIRKEARQTFYEQAAHPNIVDQQQLQTDCRDLLVSNLEIGDDEAEELGGWLAAKVSLESDDYQTKDRDRCDLFIHVCDQLVTHPNTLLSLKERQTALHEARQNIHRALLEGERTNWLQRQAMKFAVYDAMQWHFLDRAQQLREALADPLFPEEYRPTTQTALQAIEDSAFPKYFHKLFRPEE